MLRTAGLLATLALVISACSQAPPGVAAPALEPQFGTADADFGVDVALGSSGRVYALSEQEGRYYEDGFEEGSTNRTLLSRYDGSGKRVWSKEVTSYSCDFSDDCYTDNLATRALAVDAQGYLYSLVSYSYVFDDSHKVVSFEVFKNDASGNRIRNFSVGRTGYGFGSERTDLENIADMAVDGGGNVYFVRVQYDFDDNFIGSYRNVISKFSTAGALQWERTSTVGEPKSVSVSSSGSVYIAGSTGVAKYSSAGNLVWTKAGAANDIAAVGTNTVYARNLTTVRKLDANGKQLWSKAQGGLNGVVVGDMTTDGSANVYLTGKYNASFTNRDVFTRKLSASSGATVFTKTFGTPAYDDARGVATLNGSEVYLTGATKGALAHPFRGGDTDGYVRKLNASGNPVWTR